MPSLFPLFPPSPGGFFHAPEYQFALRIYQFADRMEEKSVGVSMAVYRLEEDGRRGIIRAEKIYFERDCVLYVAGRYTPNFFVAISPLPDNAVEIVITAKDKDTIPKDLLRQFLNDCIDQQIRLDLQKEFGELRQAIVTYAFSPVEKVRA